MRLRAVGVSFSYGSISALQGASFELAEGEILGVLGPNGSGKTTLLRCINHNLRSQKGTVFLDALDIAEMDQRAVARSFAVVPQDSTLEFPFAVSEIVQMGRYPHEATTEEWDLTIVHGAMGDAGILHLARRSFFELSGGERQRVIIARALAQQPEVLLLDEPTLHLDPRAQIEILECVVTAARTRGILVVLVSHDVNLAIRYCSRFLLMKGGRIQSAGTLEQVITAENLSEVFGIRAVVSRPGEMPFRTVTFLPDSGVR